MAYTISSGMGGWGGGGGVKILEKYLLVGSDIFMLVEEGVLLGGRGGHEIVNLELHNPSIKSIFRITKLICLYF